MFTKESQPKTIYFITMGYNFGSKDYLDGNLKSSDIHSSNSPGIRLYSFTPQQLIISTYWIAIQFIPVTISVRNGSKFPVQLQVQF
jgi:hypothetical protein